jgi:hypothetical protein
MIGRNFENQQGGRVSRIMTFASNPMFLVLKMLSPISRET